MELQVRALRKTYGSKVALEGLDYTFRPGVTGLVGPNGSGKTTLMRLLATTLAPACGSILWKGADAAKHPDALRRDLLYVPQNFAGYPNMTAIEFLVYLAQLRGVRGRDARATAGAALDAVGLADDRKRRLQAFTPGMMQRLSIAYVLSTDAAVVLLDEPTAGLDPAARRLFSDAIARRAHESIVILCTHIFEDLQALAGRVLALRDGRLADDAPGIELERVYAAMFELEAAS